MDYIDRDTRRYRGNKEAKHYPITVPSLQGTYQALSIILGPYSSVVQRLRQQENMRVQRTEQALKGEGPEDLYTPPVALEPPALLSKLFINLLK